MPPLGYGFAMAANVKLGGFVFVAMGLTLAGAAHALVTEPNGDVIPKPLSGDLQQEQPIGSGYLQIQKLFDVRAETLDWRTSASTNPNVFSPMCRFTGTLVLHGGGCKVDFGWYNVPADGVTPPPDGELYTLVPKESVPYMQPEALMPDGGSFLTGAADGGSALLTFASNDIRTNPNYKGGLIGFAIRGNPAEYCKQTHYSQPELNQECTASTCTDQPGTGKHWIVSLIYQSTVTPNAYYVTFEDLSTSETQFDPPVSGQWGDFRNDGDLNDFIYFITGVTCKGGGKPCDTGKPGACAIGKTDCSADGSIVCRQQLQPSAEKCDNIDNNCDGVVDEGDLCGAGNVCDQGNCVPACGRGEFTCSAGLVCTDKGLCADPACATKVCDVGKVCQPGTGACIDPCDGVVCPVGQNCELGRCLDLCADVKCDADQACDHGVCVANCSCQKCDTGKTCQTDGRCVDTGCENKTCDPGTVCVATDGVGACVDACQGVVCPGGAACDKGVCGEPSRSGNGNADASAGDDGGTIPGLIFGAGGSGNGGTAGAAGTGTTAGDSTGNGDPGRRADSTSGCGCRVGPSASSFFAAVGALALAAMWVIRRRRAK
jgi:MYXO-CTERM domain-containing protein